jgi:molybdopterin converting factor small subunit
VGEPCARHANRCDRLIVARLLLFAAAAQAAGARQWDVDQPTVGAVLDEAVERFGPGFAAVLPTCAVWCNGEPAHRDTPVRPDDEVAVLPPVSGGAA